MKEFGITSNIMSLTGIAIAIGVLVDAAIVVTENVIRHCERGRRKRAEKGEKGSERSSSSRPLCGTETWDVTLAACSRSVGRSSSRWRSSSSRSCRCSR
jgi:Cu(I)/Ag(I) efflux system membrane protein CusA/SilA